MAAWRRISMVGAGGLTLLLALLVSDNQHPWGVRDGLAGLQWLLLCPPRWLCLALALGVGLREGRFDWVAPRAAVRWPVVLGAHFGMGLASYFSLVFMSEASPVPLWLRASAVLAGLVVPAALIAFLARPIGGRVTPTVWRALLVAGVLIDAAAGAGGGWYNRLSTLEARRMEAAEAAEAQARGQAGLADLAQVPDDAPLERWLPYIDARNHPYAVTTRALDTIRARPHLTQELTSVLRGGDASTRALALNYLAFGASVLPPLPGELLPPVRDALNAEAAFLRARPDPSADTFDPPCLDAMLLPQRFPGHEAEFVEPFRELRAACDRLPKTTGDPAIGQRELDDWLHSHDPGGLR